MADLAAALYDRLAETAAATGLRQAQVRQQVVDIVLGVLDDPAHASAVAARLVAAGALVAVAADYSVEGQAGPTAHTAHRTILYRLDAAEGGHRG